MTAILAITLLSHVAVTVLWFNYQTIITRLVTGDSNFSNIFLYVDRLFRRKPPIKYPLSLYL
ncbi:hypothetical protein, partial [Bacteroides thetaiotaomicron]|uniref:hypothetical protein n=1 Tax=Bacteroides thetaiotaomicron TaxID=818 RepID=UPI0035BE699E